MKPSPGSARKYSQEALPDGLPVPFPASAAVPVSAEEGIASLEAEYGIRLPSGSFFLAVVRPDQPDPSVGQGSPAGTCPPFFWKNYTAPSRLLLCRKGGEHPSHRGAHLLRQRPCPDHPVRAAGGGGKGLFVPDGAVSEHRRQQPVYGNDLHPRRLSGGLLGASAEDGSHPDGRAVLFPLLRRERRPAHAGQPSVHAFPCRTERSCWPASGRSTVPLTEQILNQYFSRLDSLEGASTGTC